MVNNDDFEMNIPNRTREGGRRLSSGRTPDRGRRRSIDVDENDVYRPLSVMISERLHRKIGLAVVASGKTKVQLVVECVEPVVDEILRAEGIAD